jgi:cobalamin biosynthetic protein CobC
VHETTDAAELAKADIAVICNPNNPDGRRHTPAELLALADTLAARNGLLVVDEAFADLEPQPLSLAPALPHPGIVILRSFGKTYGLAGLRLGFVLAAPDHAARIRAALGPWCISGPALAAGLQALPDAAWRSQTIRRLDTDIARLDTIVTKSALALAGGTRLFRLYEGTTAAGLHERLANAGILVRRFMSQPHRLRFGLPANDAQWDRLKAALP